MTSLDRWLQRWRIARARRHVPEGARVLDVGSDDGALFRALTGRIGEGVGIDPSAAPQAGPGFRILRGWFPADLPDDEKAFGAIVMLAVLEHIPPEQQRAVAEACHRLLEPGGVVVVTTPAPAVDPLLDALVRLRLIDGMALDQHHGFRPAAATPLFREAGLEPVVHTRFQLGLNHLFVFRRPG